MLSNGSPNAALRTTDQLNEVISMARCLLPAIPDSSSVMLEDLPACPGPGSGGFISISFWSGVSHRPILCLQS